MICMIVQLKEWIKGHLGSIYTYLNVSGFNLPSDIGDYRYGTYDNTDGE